MRKVSIIIIGLLIAASASAQQQFREEQPDYSRDTLLRLFAEGVEREEVESRFEHRFGMVQFKVGGMRFRVGYLPFFMPMHGSTPWDHHQRWPDPFIITGTEIASPPRTWRDQRAMSAELRRIERRLRNSQTVVVNPE
jgi:hypothetical protein